MSLPRQTARFGRLLRRLFGLGALRGVGARATDTGQRRRQARAAVLTWIAVLIGIQAALALALDNWLAFLRNPARIARGEKLHDLLREEPDRPLLLILGSSRTLHGVRPDLLIESQGPNRVSAFNFALPGYRLTHQCVAFRRLLREGIRPRGLLVEITPTTLSLDPGAVDSVHLSTYSRDELPDLARFRPADELYQQWLLLRVVPLFTHRFHIMCHIAPNWVPGEHREDRLWRESDRWGWMPCPYTRTDPKYLEAARRQHREAAEHFQVQAVQRQALREILDDCTRMRVPVLLLLPPEGPIFRSWYAPQAEGLLQELLDEMKRDYGVTVIDARQWFDTEGAFADSHHMLPATAEPYTRRLSHEAAPFLAKLKAQGRREN